MTSLSDFVEPLKREIAPPGRFAGLFPETTDVLLAAALVDAVYRAKLDGFLPSIEADPDTAETTPDISRTAVQLLVVYAATQFIRAEITNRRTAQRFEAKGLVADQQSAATVLVERLKELEAVRLELVTNAQAGNLRTPVHTLDGYAIRLDSLYSPDRALPYGHDPSLLA